MWAARLRSRQVRKYRRDPVLHYRQPVMIQCLRGIRFQVVFVLSVCKISGSTVNECQYKSNARGIFKMFLK